MEKKFGIYKVILVNETQIIQFVYIMSANFVMGSIYKCLRTL